MSPLDRVRTICLAQPRATEKLSHGMPMFFIEKGRSFAWFVHDHHGDGITSVAVKVGSGDELAFLMEADPENFYGNKYLVPLGMICLRLDTGDTDWERVEARIEQSWAYAATPRLREQFGR